MMMYPNSGTNDYFDTISLDDSSISEFDEWDDEGRENMHKNYAEVELGKVKDSDEQHNMNAYSLDELNHFRNRARVIVQDERFQLAIIGLIVLNSVLMGIATFDFVKGDQNVLNLFEHIDMLILVIFTVELGMNLLVYSWDFFKDNWFLFDFASIMLSWAFTGITIIRAFRVFRAFRLFARVGSLKKIVSALMSTGEQMAAIILVLALIFYIFGVMVSSILRKDL